MSGIQSKYNPVSPVVLKEYNAFRHEGPKDMLCYVPFSSLTLSWLGNIYACTYNRNVLLGRYPADSLRDIWFGDKLHQLRDHIAHNDLDHGCQHCRYFIEKGKFSGLKPLEFDRYSDIGSYSYPKVMEFELTNTCNLECIMCNGFTSSAIRKNRDNQPPIPMYYDDNLIDQLEEFIPHLEEAKFFGGEPFLINLYYKIWDRIMAIKPDIKIFVITNGTVLNDKVREYIENGHFLLAISIDSLRKDRFEKIRKNAVFEEVMENLKWFNTHPVHQKRLNSLSFTTQRENWDELPEVVMFCNRNNMKLFNSYLKEPLKYSLLTLPSHELESVRNELASHTLPDGTDLERENKRVYDDFVRFLEMQVIRNREAELKGEDITMDVPLTDAPTINEVFQEDFIAENRSSHKAGVIERYRKKKDEGHEYVHYSDRQDFYQQLTDFVQEKYYLPSDDIIECMEEVLNHFNDPELERRIFDTLGRSPIETVAYVFKYTKKDILINRIGEFYGLKPS